MKIDIKNFSEVNGINWSDYEVTNNEYQQFLGEIELTKPKVFLKSQIDSIGWRAIEGSEPYERNYHKPAFGEHPVVNITLEGAKAYCEWKTQKANKLGLNVRFRLPHRVEFQNLINSVNIDFSRNEYWWFREKYCFNLRYEEGLEVDGGLLTNSAKEECKAKKSLFGKSKLLNLIGNVSEILSDGTVAGGSWNSYPTEVRQIANLKMPNPTIGFRMIMEKDLQ